MIKSKKNTISFITIILVVLISLSIVFVCLLNRHHFVFQEKTYCYSGTPYKITDMLCVEDFSITLDRISNAEFNNATSINVIENSRNSAKYSVKITIRFSNEEQAQQYDFELIQNRTDQPDTYWIKLLNTSSLAIDNIEIALTASSKQYHTNNHKTELVEVAFYINNDHCTMQDIPLILS